MASRRGNGQAWGDNPVACNSQFKGPLFRWTIRVNADRPYVALGFG